MKDSELRKSKGMKKDMPQSPVDLAKLFKAVTEALTENQGSLNDADSYNSNHGDNMVDIFKTITKAVGKKNESDAGSALAHASQILKKELTSGSSKAYAEGLGQAAKAFKSKRVTQENALEFIQTLLGGGAAPPVDSSALGGDLLGNLLGGLAGGQQEGQAANEGLDLEELISAGMAFLQEQQQGGTAIESLIQAVVAAGELGSSPHRSKSGQLVGNTLMQVLGALRG
jgi:hypothetical protein